MGNRAEKLRRHIVRNHQMREGLESSTASGQPVVLHKNDEVILGSPDLRRVVSKANGQPPIYPFITQEQRDAKREAIITITKNNI